MYEYEHNLTNKIHPKRYCCNKRQFPYFGMGTEMRKMWKQTLESRVIGMNYDERLW